MEQEIKQVGGLSEKLSEKKFGFRKNMSTLATLEKVLKTAVSARKETKRTRTLGALIVFDVRNTFNSDPWQNIFEELCKRRVAPQFDREVIETKKHSYLGPRGTDRSLGSNKWNTIVISG